MRMLLVAPLSFLLSFCVGSIASANPVVVQSKCSTVATFAVTLNAKPQAGDILIAWSSSSSALPTVAAGWTSIDTNTTARNAITAYHLVGSNESATQTAFATQSGGVAMYEVTGSNNLIDQHGITANNTSVNPPTVTTTALTPSGSNDLALVFASDSVSNDGNPTSVAGTSLDCNPLTANATGYAGNGTPSGSTTYTITWPTAGTGSKAVAGVVMLAPSTAHPNFMLMGGGE